MTTKYHTHSTGTFRTLELTELAEDCTNRVAYAFRTVLTCKCGASSTIDHVYATGAVEASMWEHSEASRAG